MKTIYFVRHGEAEGNLGGFSQTAKTPLTETGHLQAKQVAKRFKNVPVDIIFASTMDRAIDTAQHIAEIKDSEVVSTEYFHEVMKPSTVQGKSHSSSEYLQYEKLFAENYSDDSWRFEDGENFSDILSRVSKGIEMFEDRKEQNIVIVSHGRLLRFIASYLLHNKILDAGTEYRTAGSLSATNTGITTFTYDGRWKLITWNDISHFAE